LHAINDRNNILLELYQQLLNQPWDLSGGEYLFYLKSTINEIREIETSLSISSNEAAIVNEMRGIEKRIIAQSEYIHQIEGEILGELMSDLSHLTSSEINHKSFQTGQNSVIELSYFILPPSIKQPQIIALAFQFDKDYLLTDLFPRVLSAIELGKDITVGILNEKDSLMYLQNNLQITKYLVAENFTQFFLSWKVALFDTTGKSIEQLSGRERHLYLSLFIGILAVMLMGIITLARAVIHESEVSRMKSDFVSNVTHELKTPLSLIRMFGETLDSGIVTEESKRREFYSIIRKESERLTHLINNVLDYSKIDSGKKDYNFEETDLVAIIRHSLEAYKFHVRDKGFEIESKIPEEPMMINIDKDAISQAFLNLLSNAVKYSEERKHIIVEVCRESDAAIISVTDHGVGIAREELKKIFEKFYRVPNNMVKQPRGSGLGLTLTRHIINAHRGTIDADSEPGKGSTFTIRLPLS
jgi:signal transduction histidine kinase